MYMNTLQDAKILQGVFLCSDIYVRPQGSFPAVLISYVVIIFPCLGISFSASAESSVYHLPEAV